VERALIRLRPRRLRLPAPARWTDDAVGVLESAVIAVARGGEVAELEIGAHRLLPGSEPDASILACLVAQLSRPAQRRTAMTLAAGGGPEEASVRSAVSTSAREGGAPWVFTASDTSSSRAGQPQPGRPAPGRGRFTTHRR
jgi:hypothetical protein